MLVLFNIAFFIAKIIAIRGLSYFSKPFPIIALQSKCIHGMVVGGCLICQSAWEAAAAKRKALLHPLIIEKKAAFSSTMANCEHKWSWISDDQIHGVVCDFGLPIHDVQSGLASFCGICHAVGCLTCI